MGLLRGILADLERLSRRGEAAAQAFAWIVEPRGLPEPGDRGRKTRRPRAGRRGAGGWRVAPPLPVLAFAGACLYSGAHDRDPAAVPRMRLCLHLSGGCPADLPRMRP